jgi:hypothetical protein
LLTNGIVDIDSSSERICAEFTGNIAEDLIKEYEKGKSEIKEFTKALEILADQVTMDKDDSKIVIIIDELDRCRPTYAVQLLERIKHLFGVGKVVFILGIDRSQLIHSIKSLYGTEFDAVGYLRRFIDLDYQLPEPKSGDYCSYLFKHFGIEELILKRSGDRYGDLQTLRAYLGILMSAARMSLREQEQTIARLRIVLQTIPFDRYLYPITLSILLFLREYDFPTYKSFVDGKSNIDVVISLVENLPNFREAFDTNREVDEYSIESHLLAQSYYLAKAKKLDFFSSRLNDYEELSKSDSSSPEVKKAQYIFNEVSRLSSSNYRTLEIIATVDRLSFVNQFVSSG